MNDQNCHIVYIKLPGSIWDESSQKLRDDVEEWLATAGVDDSQYETFYFRDPESAKEGDWYHQSISSNKYVCYCFENRTHAMHFKLAFG